MVERLPPLGQSLAPGFRPLLRASNGAVWLAIHESAQAVYIAGLPRLGEEDVDRFSTTLFFNALRHLLSFQSQQPIYQLTSPSQLDMTQQVVALHPGEGHSHSIPTGSPLPNTQTLTQARETGQSPWPWILLAACLVFLLERFTGVWGGVAWR